MEPLEKTTSGTGTNGVEVDAGARIEQREVNVQQQRQSRRTPKKERPPRDPNAKKQKEEKPPPAKHPNDPFRWEMINPLPEKLRNTVEKVEREDFRVLTFNLLAPGTVRRESYEFCNSTCLKWTYRRSLIVKLLSESQADVICVQECDETAFQSFLKKEMETRGFTSRFKCGRAKHGIAIFYRSSLFEEIVYREVEYKRLAEGREGIEQEELGRGNVGQVLALRSTSDPTRGIIVTNTHLFWNWKYEFVKLKQMEMLLDQLLSLKKELSETHTATSFSPVMAGDFNLCPDSKVYSILTRGFMSDPESDIRVFLTPDDHSDSTSNDLEKVVNDGLQGWSGYKRPPSTPQDHARLEEAVALISRWTSSNPQNNKSTLPLLASAYSRYCHLGLEDVVAPKEHDWSGEPPHTCHVQWTGTIDYIYVLRDNDPSRSWDSWDGVDATSHLQLVNIMKLPTAKELSVQTAIPNDWVPSDHIPLMASFAFLPPSAAPKESDK